MGNFESGPALRKHDGEIVRWEDAAETVTITGWKCKKCGMFYGDDERAARYCCHTDAPCKCGNRKQRHMVYCGECYHNDKIDRWNKTAQVEAEKMPMPNSPWSILDDDEYFFDCDSFLEWCVEHEVKPSECFPILCRQHNPPAFNLSEWLDDYLPGEEREMVGSREDIEAVENAVNDFTAKHVPFSWYGDSKRRPSDAALAALDLMIDDTPRAGGKGEG